MNKSEIGKEVFSRLDAEVEWNKQRRMRAVNPFTYLFLAFTLFAAIENGVRAWHPWLVAHGILH